MTRLSVVSVKMTVKKTDTGDAGLFYLLFCTVYCNENRLKNNMTPYEPGADAGFFSSRFSSDRKTEIFFLPVREPKYFFSGQSKNKIFFFLNRIYARNIFF